jgi:TrmH family RNA methyltransferase
MLTRLISSLQHPIVKKICKLRQDNAFRKTEGLIVLSKDTILEEVNQKETFETLLFLEGSTVYKKLKSKEFIPVTRAVLEKCLGYESKDTCVALLKTPNPLKNYSFPWLVLDGIQDPGNLGTLLRSALAFNFKTIILLEPSADPYNDKSIKSARGATFHLEIHQMNHQKFIQLVKPKNSSIVYADAKGQPLKTIEFPNNLVLVLGNEGHGVSSTIQQLGKAIAVEMNPLSESLNVAIAGSIIMYKNAKPT